LTSSLILILAPLDEDLKFFFPKILNNPFINIKYEYINKLIMDEFLSKFEMFFHPLMEINYNNVIEEKILPRQTVKILTYNIFLRPPPVKNNENDWKDERMADFIKLLDCFDIICLQEMFGSFNNRKQELIKYANKSGLFFYCDSPSPSFFSRYIADGGLLILSRY
jgi:hypothetical protein